MPSNNKKEFLKDPLEAKQLSAKKIHVLATHLEKKHGICIVVNGETHRGQAFLKKIATDYPIEVAMERENEIDLGLTQGQVRLEIRDIQQTIKKDQAIGYVWTNGLRFDSGHFEAVIILNDIIIKPIPWNVDADNTLFLINHNRADSDLKHFIQVESIENGVTEVIDTVVIPQSNDVECGTLSLLYLKELLKNNGEQLNQHSLIVPFYLNNAPKYFFFSSPHVLRYSQSTAYAEIMNLMLTPTKQTIIYNHKENNYRIKTLHTILEETMAIAIKKGDVEIYDKCDVIASTLDQFTERWVAQYQQAIAKRAEMRGSEYNEYLAYRTNTLYKKGSVSRMAYKALLQARIDKASTQNQASLDNAATPIIKL